MNVPKSLGDNVKVGLVKDLGITSLKILDEGTFVKYAPLKDGDREVEKLVVKVSFDGQKDHHPFKWPMNDKSRNAVIDIYGDESSKWEGKTIDIQVAGAGEFEHIAVDVVRTEKRKEKDN